MSEFKINKVGKLCDEFESQAYEWVLHDIQQHFGITTRDTAEFTKGQIQELEHFMETADYIEAYCAMVIRSMIDSWYQESAEYGN